LMRFMQCDIYSINNTVKYTFQMFKDDLIELQ
jgi:hypothetical protein